jgi:hypothetical protein
MMDDAKKEDYVKNAYPDAKLSKYFIYNKWYPCIHSYTCGELLDECVEWTSAPPPKNNSEAWDQAVRYVNREMLRKLEK